MNLYAVLLVGVAVLSTVCGAPNPCIGIEKIVEPECNETQYETYRKCIEEAKQWRHKRQACVSIVEPIVVTEEPKQRFEIVQPVKIDDSGALPQESLVKTIIIRPEGANIRDDDLDDLDEDDDNQYRFNVPANGTTIIRLVTIVNNTNTIHVPTTLNHTNVNNFHIYNNATAEDEYPDEDAPSERCCIAVQPKSCKHPSKNGTMCQHKKFKTCGKHCKSNVVHIQRRKRCDGDGNCSVKVVYVPQPTEKATCVYTNQWPFVACGRVANMDIVCDGCYDHYGYEYDGYASQLIMPEHCRGCYDDAFNTGPLYRRGPVLRPFYNHEPPCYLFGTCPQNAYVDPVWGQPQPFNPNFSRQNTILVDPSKFDTTNETSDDWGLPFHKCTVIGDDNTILIKNCTNSVSNPFEAAPTQHPFYKPVDLDKKHADLTELDSSGDGDLDNNVNLIPEDDDIDYSY